MDANGTGIDKLRRYVQAMTRLIEAAGDDEARIIADGRKYLGDLVAQDDWLPETFAKPHPEHYQQYLLHCDPLERFSVVSFVWGPGQKTPVHDHTVWGLIGMLRGSERSTAFAPAADGKSYVEGETELLKPGDVSAVSPRIGDIHQVANELADTVSISIHTYGANIGAVRRHVFDAKTGAAKDFVSGYGAAVLPNPWDRSAAVRSQIR